MELLKNGKAVPKSSHIYQLSPYIDENGVLRVHGRIDNANCIPQDTRRPIILSKEHHFTRLLAIHQHEQMHHQNHEAVICEIRRKYWIPNIRSLVKKIKCKCKVCKIQSAKPKPPLMGQLPEDRV